jgi:regulator of sigma E protease
MHILLEVVTFLVVIIVLILVHELGHFIIAKLSRMRVDEFGFGLPPRALTMAKVGETEYTLNWLPFGGFVRIYGEDGTEENPDPAVTARAFSSKPRILQGLVLIAGIVMNLIFAYILIVASLTIGNQQELTYGQENGAKDVTLAIGAVLPTGPAGQAGFMVGDEIKNAEIIEKTVGIGYNQTNPLGETALISHDTEGDPMIFTIVRNGKTMNITVVPKTGVIASNPSQAAIGVGIIEVGIVKTPILQSFHDGVIVFAKMISETVRGLYQFFKGIVTFKADFSQVSGPVGIAGVVGQATATGFGELLSLTALISINLAIINLLPIPALDGGRLLFVIIEAITQKPIKPKVAERVNMIGFGLLILLMLAVTAHDIFKLFH